MNALKHITNKLSAPPDSTNEEKKMNTTTTAAQIGTIITKLRTEKGWKQNQLSAMLSISPGNLSNYEHGLYWPALDMLCKIADLFNVSTDFLLGRTGYRCPPETFREYVTPDCTMYHIINILLELDTGSRDAVVKYATYLKEANPCPNPRQNGRHPSRKVPARRKKAD